MRLDSPAVVLDVPDSDASRAFLTVHLGFRVLAEGEGFSALGHEDHGLRIILRPLPPGVTPPGFPGLQIGFLVTGIDGHWARLTDAVEITEPIATEAAERAFRVADPNGVGYRLIELVA
ncbi:MAG: glyoxalase [Rhodococcus sp. (in: high G+C Gram-positive bacteria)]|nr:MAG: glyoxalase [Rhodococcus sp. (in: high G+C Gram-positive bacteria)]